MREFVILCYNAGAKESDGFMRRKLCVLLTLALLLMQAQAFGEEVFRQAGAIGNFSEGYAAFSNENGLWGYIDAQRQRRD